MNAPRQYRQHRFSLPRGGTEILLVRHGETIPSVSGQEFDLLDGQGDPPLAPEGREQAERVAERLAGEEIDAIYVTTLRRTSETAAPLAARVGLTPIVEADLREVHLGEWEGGRYREHVAEGHPLARELLRQQRWDVIPGAESNEAFAARLRAGISRMAAAHHGQRIVAVAHGGTIGMILAIASGSRPFAFIGADNGSISRIVVVGETWLVRGFNEVSHLG
ncbi:MAG TPA: histidine phosphatase family protein [Acidimicrobiales bacterium]|nr:histidine phosphatase family protein [Acidimicrobiales bacterium]